MYGCLRRWTKTGGLQDCIEEAHECARGTPKMASTNRAQLLRLSETVWLLSLTDITNSTAAEMRQLRGVRKRYSLAPETDDSAIVVVLQKQEHVDVKAIR